MRRYGLTTDNRIERGSPPAWKRNGTTRGNAIAHAQKAANHLRCDVLVVEEIEGMSRKTRISPKTPCTCIACR